MLEAGPFTSLCRRVVVVGIALRGEVQLPVGVGEEAGGGRGGQTHDLVGPWVRGQVEVELF